MRGELLRSDTKTRVADAARSSRRAPGRVCESERGSYRSGLWRLETACFQGQLLTRGSIQRVLQRPLWRVSGLRDRRAGTLSFPLFIATSIWVSSAGSSVGPTREPRKGSTRQESGYAARRAPGSRFSVSCEAAARESVCKAVRPPLTGPPGGPEVDIPFCAGDGTRRVIQTSVGSCSSRFATHMQFLPCRLAAYSARSAAPTSITGSQSCMACDAATPTLIVTMPELLASCGMARHSTGGAPR